MAEEWDGRGWSGKPLDGKSKHSSRSIADIKQSYPITQVLSVLSGGRFRLPSDSGGGWVAVHCPFHPDSNASASINVGLGRFRCHSCDTAGDALDVVQEVLGLGTVQEARDWIISNS